MDGASVVMVQVLLKNRKKRRFIVSDYVDLALDITPPREIQGALYEQR